MSEFSHIPLFDDWIAFSDTHGRTESSFSEFVSRILTPDNVEVPGSTVTAFYSGEVGQRPAFQMAQDLAERSGGTIRIIDNTNIGRFLNTMLFDPDAGQFLGFTADADYRDEQFGKASKLFAAETHGRVITITPNSRVDRVYADIELKKILDNPNIESVNGRPIDEIKSAYNSGNAAAKSAFFKALFDGDFAHALAFGGARVLEKTVNNLTTAVLDLTPEVLAKLGLSDIDLDPPSGTVIVTSDALRSQMADVRARAKLVDMKLTALINEPDVGVNKVGSDLFNEPLGFQIERVLVANMIKAVDFLLGVPEKARALFDLVKVYLDKVPDKVGEVTQLLGSLIKSLPNILDDVADAIKIQGQAIVNAFDEFVNKTTAQLDLPDLTVANALKGGALLGSLALGVLEVVVQHKRFGGFTEDFFKWLGTTVATAAVVAVPLVKGVAFVAGLGTFGLAAVIGLGVAGTVFAIHQLTQDILEVYADEPDSWIYKSAQFVDAIFDAVGGQLRFIVEAAAELVQAFAEKAVKTLQDFLLPNVQFVDGLAAGFILEEGQWLIGSDAAVLIGNEDDNVLIHSGAGEALGLGGDDLLLGWGADVINQGDPIGPEPAEGEEDNRPIAEQDMRLVLNGGAGDDWVIALGGTGAILIGGAGSDFLFNTSFKGQLYGDTVDGQGGGDTDVFWYWPNTFIMDAGPEDILQFFGIPLLGGSNTIVGVIDAGPGALAIDWLNWTTFYGRSDSGQLLIYNALFDGTMVVEDYTFGGFRENGFAVPEPGDLGMTFRIFGATEGEIRTISAFASAWGHVMTWGLVIRNLAKMLVWEPVDDPLVLDLDGDGIETVSESQSGVHFDLDGDYFAESTGWLGADDGFLVLDRDGNGRIDDITEMFGAPGVSGYDELAALDDNADGVITLDDAAFAELRVWRDLDQDGVTDEGELFTLDELQITSIGVTGTALGSETPQGTTLRARGDFTRADGSTGDSYEAIFETSPTDTIFRGERGTAEWLRDGTGAGNGAIDAKGLGAMTSLAVGLSNDFELAAVVESAAAAMTLPSLKDIREQATPVYGAWSQSLELTRELTPVLLDKAAGGTSLLDRAVYQEDAGGGYWTLASGNPVLDDQGAAIARPSLEQVMAQATTGTQVWQLEQMFSPSSRAAALTQREEAPYLVTIVDDRAVIQDYGIDNGDGSWRLASGAAVFDGDGNPIAAPTREDIIAQTPPAGSEWRLESLGFNPYAEPPAEVMGVQLIDGVVVDYSVQVTDADGSFQVWARNLDRALELQHKLGQPGDFVLRNFELDFETLDEVGSSDDSAYRVELLTAGQLHFASSIFGIDFQPKIMAAETDPESGLISYSVGDFNGEAAPTSNPDGSYNSAIEPAIELFDGLMQNYIVVSRAFAVRLALQGGLERFARELAYDATNDRYTATGDRELAPMFEAIFEEAPAGATAAADYLAGWREILEVIYPDYHVDQSTNFVTGAMALDQAFVMQMLLPAYELVGIDADLPTVLNALGVDQSKLIAHDAAASEVTGTSGDDFIYLSGGDQIYRGGYGKDVYFVGSGFGNDVIEDLEYPLQLGRIASDQLRFAHAKSSDVHATRDGLDLVLEVIGTNDVLRVKNQFEGETTDPLFGQDFSPDTEMVTIVFADGVIWDRFQIAKAVSHPLDSGDLVLGSQAKDYLEGGKGSDVLRGGRDGDIYVFNTGDGDDRIADDNDRPTDDPRAKYDLLQFRGDFNADNLLLRRVGESDDLEIIINDANGLPTGDRVVIEDQFDWINVPILGLMFPDTIERISFEDGSFLTERDVMARVLEAAKTDGADIIYGFNNRDVLDGGAGNDVLTGRAQNDTYVFGRGYGHDVIDDSDDDFFAASFDVLQFRDDLRWTDFDFLREGDSATITLQVTGTQDAVVLKDQFKSTFFLGFTDRIEQIDFGDGTTWDYFKLAQHVIDLEVSDGDDLLYGFEIADRLDGGAGNDRLEGGAGADSYVFARGYGTDTVFDLASGGQGDSLLMRDIAFGDVDISRTAEDLIFTVRDTGEQLVLSGQYVRTGEQTHAVETFVFSDQTVDFRNLNPEDVDLVGTSAGETLTGSAFGETIDGRGGDDTLIGGSDGDTYLFDSGSGHDVVIDRQERAAWFDRGFVRVKETDDTILFGADISEATAVFTKDGDDLVISITDRPDTLRIRNQFRDIEDGVEWYEFNDGTRLHISDIEERLAIVGGSRGDDLITGAPDAPNVLDGRQGDDSLVGGHQGDTYAFGAAYDLDQILESDSPAAGAVDRVVFAASVSPETIQLSRAGNDLIFDLGNGEDRLTIVDGLSTRQVEAFLFADGSSWTLEDVRSRLLTGSQGDDSLAGFDDRDDVLDGLAGSDALEGGGGNDTYHFGLGSGDDSVADTGGVDRIVFGAGISAAMVRFSDEGGDLLVRLAGAEDTLIVLGGAADAGSATLIESFHFDDGTVLGMDEVLRSIVTAQATPGGDVIDARAGLAIELAGGPGDDLILGEDGGTYVFRAGDGSDILDTAGQSGSSTLVFEDLASADAVVRRVDLDGPDVLIAFPATGDQVLLRAGLTTSNVETVVFADGVEWSQAEIVVAAVRSQASARDDVITGSNQADTIEGGTGDDDIEGGPGDDVYLYQRGDGRDIITDRSGTDRLEVRGYRPEEMMVSRPVADRDELLLTFAPGADEILIPFSSFRGIEVVAFGDGSEITRTELEAMAIGQGTPFDDVITGSDGDNVLAGGPGNDQVSGDRGNDTYLFGRGQGRDVIEDSGFLSDVNRLVIQDYGPGEATLLRFEDRPDDLTLRFSGGDEIVIRHAFNNNKANIDEIEFQDGTVWAQADFLTQLEAQRDAGRGERLIGTAAADSLVGGGGDDLLSGEDGSDSYVFTRGDGRDTIQDSGHGDTDVLIIHGYTPAELLLSRGFPSDTLVIEFVGTDDRITVVNTLDGALGDQIEEIRFDDGTVWTIAMVKDELVANGRSDRDDTIDGTNAADTLAGGIGNDALSGANGSDVYVFHRGDGRDVIEDNGSADTDKLLIHGYTPAEVILSRAGTGDDGANDIRIAFVGTDDEIVLINTFDANFNDAIEQVRFDDGTVWTAADLRDLVYALEATDGDDRIAGIRLADSLEGGLGNDRITGGDGSDSYIFTRGDGRDTYEDNGSADTDKLFLHGYTPGEVVLSRSGTGEDGNNDLRIAFVGTDDEIVLLNTFDDNFHDAIDEIRFDDGTVWTPDDLRAMVYALEATAADDLIRGTVNADTLTGGLGNDALFGGNASDVYVFNRGDGRLAVEDNGSADTDKLVIHGYTPAELLLSQAGTGGDGTNDVRISFVGTDDMIVLYNTLDGNFSDAIEQIVFDDGTVWTRTDMNAAVDDSGLNQIDGTNAANTLTSTTGDDLMIGGKGSDRYIFNRGDGQDIIDDGGSNSTDVLAIQGYTPGEVTLERLAAGSETLIITFAGTTDRIIVENTLNEIAADEIEQIHFDDGTVWTMADVRAMLYAATATDGDDLFVGSTKADTFEGGLGNDVLSGGNGSDSYIFNRGDGHDTIEDGGNLSTDKLIIHGYTPGEVTPARHSSGSATLVLTFAGTSDRITVETTLDETNADEIEQIRFDDGTVWTMADVRAMIYAAEATDGDDVIAGSAAVDTLEGGLGNDVLSGGNGSDSYVFSRGDGHDIIDDDGSFSTDKVIIQGYTPDEVSLAPLAVGSGTLVLTFAGTSDRITIENTLDGGSADRIEQIHFDDGTVWTVDDITRLLIERARSDGDDIINGNGGANTLAGGPGDDRLSGGDGADLYIFARGDGEDVIEENGLLDTDAVAIQGYAVSEVLLARPAFPADALVLTFVGTDDKLTILNTLDGSNTDQVEEIRFDDGTVWTMADVKALLVAGQGTDGDDQVAGFNVADTIDAGPGDDLIEGAQGDDTYVYARGDGYDVIIDDASDSGDRLVLTGVTPDQVALQRGVGDDLEVLIAESAAEAGDGGRITVRNSFLGTGTDGIESIEFDDGTIWTQDQFETLAERNVATPGDDRLGGTSGDDRIEGLAGNDSLSGGTGDDTYVFTRGDGQDLVRDAGSGSDTIEIAGYSAAEVVFARRGREGEDLIIRLGTDGDSITVIDGLRGNTADTVEQVVLSDGGETFSLTEIRAQLVLGSPSAEDDQIIGTDLADRISGLAGSDLLLGGEGDDTYVYASGDGDDRITDSGSDTGDQLVLADIASTQLVSARRSPPDGDDLVLRFEGPVDRLTLTDSLSDRDAGVESISFSDGVVWGLEEMRAAVLSFATTADGEQIRGFAGNDLLVGGGGDDLLIGGEGDDLYRFSQGDGSDVIDDGGSSSGDRLEIVDMLSVEASVRRLFKGSDAVVLSFAGSDDSIILREALTGGGAGVEEIVFADNVTWTADTLLSLLANSVPVALDDGIFTGKQGEPIIIAAADLLRNDFDADGETLSVISVDGGADGTAQIDANGNVVFTPGPDFTGVTQFTYAVTDGRNGIASATVEVRVSPPASAKDDTGFSVDEDGFLTIDALRLLSNDVDGDRMIVAQVLEAINGSVSLASGGQISFTPAQDFNGLATFRYLANTPEGGSAEATVFIDVLAVNDAPDAVNDSGFSTDEDVAFSIDASALLTNDTDIDGDPLTVTAVLGNSDLQVELTDDGVILVTPTAFFFGQASFDYVVSDPDGATDTATVTVDVLPVNNPPEPADDAVTTDEDTPILIPAADLLANDLERDGDPLSIASVRNGQGGTASLFDNATVLFTPAANFFGQAHFFYTVDDGQGGLVEARVDVQVDPVNDAPNAADDSYTNPAIAFLDGTEDQPLSIQIADLLLNDGDIDSPTISLASVTESVNGLATIQGDGTILFTPDQDYWGEASFRYVITDDGALVDDAKVTLYFAPVGDAPPVAADDVVTVTEDVVTVIPAATLLANDTDIDLDVLEIQSVSLLPGGRGSVTIDQNGDVVFTPDPDSTRTEFFTYTVTDNADGTDTAQVRVDITPVNDAPVAAADSGATSLDVPLVLRIADLMANDSDVDLLPGQHDLLTFVGVASTSVGTASVYGDEFIVVEYSQGFFGPVSLDYTIADEVGAQADGTVSATVSDSHAATLAGSGLRDLIIGSQLGETIDGQAGDDDLFGRDGDDLLIGGDGADTIDGGAGFDRVDFAASNIGVRADLEARIGQGGHAQGDLYQSVEALSGSQFADELGGDAADNLLAGQDGADSLIGRGGNDTLEGGDGDDRLDGGLGADLLTGGAGSDTADYSASAAAVSISLGAGTASGGEAEGDVLTEVENLVGTDLNDVLVGDDGANRLDGGRGDDQLTGGDGNDVLVGGRGADQLDGGAGTDRVEYALSAEGVTINMVDGSAGGGDALGDTFTSIELVVGSFHDDTIIGDSADNVIMGGRGADSIDGGAGFDVADYSEADEAVTVDLESGLGSAGEAAGDQLAGIEMLVGSLHADSLSGSSGDDSFDGGFGDDVLTGRGGSDSYLFGFDSASDLVIESGAAADVDRIVLGPLVETKDVSIVREGDDLLIELENDDGLLIDSLRVQQHFLGRETGIEEIAFTDATVWDRTTIDDLQRLGRFNAVDDIIRFADEDVELIITADRLTGNDATEGTENLVIISVGNAVDGSVSLQPDGSVSFLGGQDFNGDAFFDYTVRDEFGRESTARAEVNVLPINDAPVAVDDGVFTGTEDIPLVIAIADIIGNDIDVDGDQLTLTGVFGPFIGTDGQPREPSGLGFGSNGNATILAGDVIFTPDSDHFGFAGFTYEVRDPSGATSTGQVELSFLAVNDAPDARTDNMTVRLGLTTSIEVTDLLANDSDAEGDAFSFLGFHTVTNGTATLRVVEEVVDGQTVQRTFIDFDPAALGPASFLYDVEDVHGAGSTGQVDINVIPLNDPPNARNDSGFETVEDQMLVIDPAALLANDDDPNDDPITITGFEPFPVNGSVAFGAGGMIEFTPRTDFNGQAGFTYILDDGRGGTDTAFVAISIVPANDPPVLQDDVVDGLEDLPITIIPAEAFANDMDPDGDVLFFENASFLGVLTDDFTNRTTYAESFDLASPLVVGTNSATAALADGSALPAWLSFDAQSLTFSGTPPGGLSPFDVKLTFSESSLGVSYEDSLTIDPADTQALADGIVYDPQLMAVDLGAGSFSAALWTGHELPAWLAFDPVARSFSLTGIDPEPGESIARVRVAFEPDNAAAAGFEVEVRIDPALPIDPAINALLAGEDYFTAQGLWTLPTASDAAVTAAKANLVDLPAWLTFDAATLGFSGLPPEKYVGTLPVRIDVGASAQNGTPAFALIRDVVIDESYSLAAQTGFSLTVTDEAIDVFRPIDFNGALAIEYNAKDTKDAVSQQPAVIVINVAPQRELPEAGDDVFAVDEDGSVEIPLTSLLANDVDDDGDPIKIVAFGAVPNGQLTVNVPELSQDLPPVAGLGTPATHSATLADGSALPAWLSIETTTGRLFGTPPLEAFETIAIKVTSDDGTNQFVTDVDLAVDGNAGTTLTYQTEPQFFGPVEFTYELADGREGSDTALVRIDVAPIDDDPTAVDDSVVGTVNQALTISLASLTANDSDVDGHTFSITAVGQAVGGTAVLDGQGNVVFTPETDRVLPGSFEYTITDSTGATDTAVVTVTLAAAASAMMAPPMASALSFALPPAAALSTEAAAAPANAAPVVQPIADQRSAEDTAIDFTLPADFAADADGDALTLTASRPGGTALPSWLSFDPAARRFTGTPPQNFAGVIAIAVTASDGDLASTATFDLVIDPENDAPTIRLPFSDRFVDEDAAFDLQLQQGLFSDVDGDALSYAITMADGSALPDWLQVEPETLRLSGQAPQDFSGTLDLRVTASDGELTTSDIFVLTVNAINDAPVLETPLADQPTDDPETALRTGEAFEIRIPEGTFSDQDGDALTLTATLAGGEALPDWMAFDGASLSGVAPTAAAGQWEVEVTASDGAQEVSDVFSLTFEAGNGAPTAAADGPFATIAGTRLDISAAELLSNDVDSDGDPLQIVAVGQGANGSVGLGTDGRISYQADSGFVGSDQFLYRISDGTDTAEGAVTVQVQEPFAGAAGGLSDSDILISSAAAGSDPLAGNAGDDIRLSSAAETLLASDSDLPDASRGSGQGDLDSDRLSFGLTANRSNDRPLEGAGEAEEALLFGRRGADVFVFGTGEEVEQAVAYQTPRADRRFTIEGDRIQLGFAGVEDVDAQLGIAQAQSDGASFGQGNEDDIFLSGTQLSALDRDSFSFF